MQVPWAVKSNQSILKEINPEYSLEGLMLKLKPQYFGHLMWRAHSLERTLILGKKKGKRRRGQQKMGWLDGITNSMDMNLSKLWETVKAKGAWYAAVHGATESNSATEQQKRIVVITFKVFMMLGWSMEVHVIFFFCIHLASILIIH